MQVWIEPFVVLSEFSQLKKLFIANVPVNWDILWILLLLDATPALESLHVHVCCFLTTLLTENACTWMFGKIIANQIVLKPGMQIDNNSEDRTAGDLCASLDVGVQQDRYRHLKELVVAGFDGLGWQAGFVRLIMKRSPLLRRVHLLDGEVRDDEGELGDLQIVPRHREWHECERAEVLDDLTTGFRWPPQIILE